MVDIDELDKNIMETLEIDARTPFLTIAKNLKVSEGTIRKRVAKLTTSGTIKKFTIERSTTLTAIVGIETNPHIPSVTIVASLKKLSIKYVYEVAGRFDIICYVATKNVETMNEILDRIRITEGIVHTETFTILKCT